MSSPFLHSATSINATSSEPVTATGFSRIGFHFGNLPLAVEGLPAQCQSIPYGDFIGISDKSSAYKTGNDNIDTFVVELNPLYTKQLLSSSDASEASSTRLPLTDLFSHEFDSLYSSLIEATFENRVNILNSWLNGKVSAQYICNISAAAISVIRTNNGNISISALSRKFEMSQRWLEKLFKREVGLTIKQYARVVRCQYASLAHNSSNSWAKVAADCGYTDQSHLTREFRSILGMTPSRADRSGYNSRYKYASETTTKGELNHNTVC